MPDQQLVNPFVFVVGCPRSGTTLLQRMLDNHPLLTVANDTHFITRAAKKVLRADPDPKLTADLVRMVLAYRRFHRMGLDQAEVEAAAENCETYAEFVSRLYTLRGQQAGKTLSGEKTPDFCRKIPALHRLFPAAKFIHISRDGRDTAMSAMNWANAQKGPGKWALWADDPLACCALWWRWQAGTGVIHGRAIAPDRYRELKYEDLVDDAPGQLTALARFLGIPDSGAMSTYYEGKTRNNPKLSAKSAWLPPTKGLRDWRVEMKEEDVTVFETVAGEVLSQLGYELSGASPGKPAQQRVERCETWWKTQRMARA